MSTKRFWQLLAILSVICSGASITANAQAAKHHSTAATVYSRTTHKATKVKVTKGTLYTSTKLTKKSANLAKAKYRKLTYRTRTTYVLKKANGKRAIYQAIVSTNGKVKGLVWHGYVHKIAKKTSKKAQNNVTDPRPSVLSVASYRAEFLKDLNAERTKRDLAPLAEDPQYDTIAQQRAGQLLTNFAHGNDTSDFIAADLFEQQGVSGLYGECISMDYLEDDQANPSANVADKNIYSYIYDDADSNWGHRDILLDAHTTVLGIGASQKGGAVYGAINTGNN